jgi:hypothetical protein
MEMVVLVILKARGSAVSCGLAFAMQRKMKFTSWKDPHNLQVDKIPQKNHLFRRFVLLREMLLSEYQVDYIIIDTSSGIRYWSINALVVADSLNRYIVSCSYKALMAICDQKVVSTEPHSIYHNR